MKMLADDMAVAGNPLGNDQFTSYVLTELDEEYNPLVSAILTRVEPITYVELLSQITSFEGELQRGGGSGSHSSVNSASRPGGVDSTVEVVVPSAATLEGVAVALGNGGLGLNMMYLISCDQL